MRELVLVFHAKAQGFAHRAFDFRWSNLLKDISSLLVFGGFIVGVFFLSRASSLYLISQAHIGQFLFHRFLSMIFYVLFITVNLGNVIVCYATLYKSEEVAFLMGLPISHESVFLVKFVDNFLHSSATLVMLALALLFGYGSSFHLPWHFYIVSSLAVLLPFMLIAGITGVMVLMLLIRVASKVGIRWLMALSVGTYFTAMYAYFAVTNPVRVVQEVMRHFPDVNKYFGYLDPPFAMLMPNHWVSEYLYWTVSGNSTQAFSYVLILNATLLGLVGLASLMAKKIYYRSWLAASDAQAARGPELSVLRVPGLEFGRGSTLAPVTDVLLKRDFWLFIREPGQWLHMLLMVVLLFASLISIGSMELKVTQPYLKTVSYLTTFLFNGFLVASVTLRFVFPAVSLEGESFWCVRTSPMDLKRLYWHKFITLTVAVLAAAEILAVVSTTMARCEGPLVVLSAASMGLVAFTMTSMHLGAGAYFASFREKNPVRVASSQGAALTFLVSMVYLAIVVLALGFPLNRYFESMLIRDTAPAAWATVPMAFIGLLSVLGSATATWIGLRSIQRDY